MRCIHEDGLDRPTNISMNGMVLGSPNKEIIKQLYMPGHIVGRVTANDGQDCYVIKGPKANVMGAVAIALWYDAIVNSDMFRICNEKERQIWNKSRHYSHMIAVGQMSELNKIKFKKLKQDREKIIQKVNRAYGPQGRHINKQREKFVDLFELFSP